MSIRYSNLFVSISTFILTLLVVMPFSVYAQQNETTEDSKDIVATAKQDAKNNESTFTWMLGGCCLIGTGIAHVAKPSPPKTALSDKSAEYVEIYEQAYESEAKKIRRTGAWIGTAGTVVAIPLAYVGFIALLIVSGAGYQ